MRWPQGRLLAVVFSGLAACHSNTPAVDAAVDAGPSDLGVVDAGQPPRWPRTLAPASVMAPSPGRWLRTIIHAHSVHSHDACDGNPYVDGGPNEPCLQSFRRALCTVKIDTVFLTEHAERISMVPFTTVLQMRDGDEPIIEGGQTVGSRIRCDDGHRVMILPGAENELMPIGLRRHPTEIEGSLERAYHDDGAAGAARFREAGALIAVPHCEQQTRDQLRGTNPDVIESYNIHANLDPRIADRVLGLPLGQILPDTIAFSQAARGLDPEWMFLAIFRENHLDLAHWAAFAAEGRRYVAVGGSDVHENSFPAIFPDGERGDSYRRVLRWYSNFVRVDGEVTRESMMAGVAAGRLYTVFEAYGTPEGFGLTAGEATVGDTVMLARQPQFQVTVPRVYGLDPSLPRPDVRVRLLKAELNGTWRELAASAETLRFTPTEPGAYRAEALITPHHARPYIPRMERLIREVPWVYSNVMRVE
ncbi:MAG: hypothetical protein JNK72_15055 [Myxococcales bacterium]|nr:hypothetical protein [Myxococcales bacterium]